MHARHRVRCVDLGLVLDQQPHHRLVAVLGSIDEARPFALPGTHESAVPRGRANQPGISEGEGDLVGGAASPEILGSELAPAGFSAG